MRIVLLVVMLSLAVVGYAEDQAAIDRVFPLETFDEYQPASFPEQWKVRGDETEARGIYWVAEEGGNHFLHARAEKQDVQIGLSHTFQPKEFPLLRWRWRVDQLPSGGDERAVKTNDSAAGVYVIFDSRIVPRVIKYVWSATLPAGTHFDSPVYWRAKVVVLQSGSSRLKEWVPETVNVYQDYKDLFGTEPGEVQGIAVLTDADSTASVAEADYDDFALLPAAAVPAGEAKGAVARFSSPLTGERQ
ncbi:MAG TPA: DUF3047 domain-containing protein [Candidatus Binatia bacterium]|nr:DUF3047 domain-containing protein [Candidatus Binatia bacterium]